MAHYRHTRLRPVPHRRIDAALAALPVPTRSRGPHADLADIVMSAMIVAVAGAIVATGVVAAGAVETGILGLIH